MNNKAHAAEKLERLTDQLEHAVNHFHGRTRLTEYDIATFRAAIKALKD